MRIACTVVSFMIGCNDVADIGKAGDPPNDGRTVLGVLAHDSELLFGEEVLFEQQFRAHFCTTVRRTNKVDPPVCQSWRSSVVSARQCFFIIWVLGIFSSPPYTVTVLDGHKRALHKGGGDAQGRMI
jgi:hypothetical protein